MSAPDDLERRVTVTRKDMRRSSRLHLRCEGCGSWETRYVDMDVAAATVTQMVRQHRCIPHEPALTFLREWFASHITETDECILWSGRTTERGYGKFGNWYVHRASHVLNVGPIPEGLTIDHLCRVKLCCNPRHLEAVTADENHRRWAESIAEACQRGHEWTPENTYIAKSGKRNCRTCRQERRTARRMAGRGRAA